MYYNILIKTYEKDFKILNVITKENLLKCLNNLLNYEFSKGYDININTNEYITFKHFIFNILDKDQNTIKKIVIIKPINKYYFEKYNKN